MNETIDQKKTSLKLKTQQKQLQVVQALINRSTGYTKKQAEDSAKRLIQEIEILQKNMKSFESEAKQKMKKTK